MIVKVHFPSGHLGFSDDDSPLDFAMRVIGVAFGKEEEEPNKYGTRYANDVFEMHVRTLVSQVQILPSAH